jgi:hypothetical protein
VANLFFVTQCNRQLLSCARSLLCGVAAILLLHVPVAAAGDVVPVFLETGQRVDFVQPDEAQLLPSRPGAKAPTGSRAEVVAGRYGAERDPMVQGALEQLGDVKPNLQRTNTVKAGHTELRGVQGVIPELPESSLQKP